MNCIGYPYDYDKYPSVSEEADTYKTFEIKTFEI